jgi:hypothetical protein
MLLQEPVSARPCLACCSEIAVSQLGKLLSNLGTDDIGENDWLFVTAGRQLT